MVNTGGGRANLSAESYARSSWGRFLEIGGSCNEFQANILPLPLLPSFLRSSFLIFLSVPFFFFFFSIAVSRFKIGLLSKMTPLIEFIFVNGVFRVCETSEMEIKLAVINGRIIIIVPFVLSDHLSILLFFIFEQLRMIRFTRWTSFRLYYTWSQMKINVSEIILFLGYRHLF